MYSSLLNFSHLAKFDRLTSQKAYNAKKAAVKAATVFITAPLPDSKTDILISLPTISVSSDAPDLTYLNPVIAVYSVPTFQSILSADEAIPAILESTLRATEHNYQEFIFGASFSVSAVSSVGASYGVSAVSSVGASYGVSAVSSVSTIGSSFSATYSNQLVYETPGLDESRIQGPVVSDCKFSGFKAPYQFSTAYFPSLSL